MSYKEIDGKESPNTSVTDKLNNQMSESSSDLKLTNSYEYKDMHGKAIYGKDFYVDPRDINEVFIRKYNIEENKKIDLNQKSSTTCVLYNYNKISINKNSNPSQIILIFQDERSCDLFEKYSNDYKLNILTTAFFDDPLQIKKVELTKLMNLLKGNQIFIIGDSTEEGRNFEQVILNCANDKTNIHTMDWGEFSDYARDKIYDLLKTRKKFLSELLKFILKDFKGEIKTYKKTKDLSNYSRFTDEDFLLKLKYLYEGEFFHCSEVNSDHWFHWNEKQGYLELDSYNRIYDSAKSDLIEMYDSEIQEENDEKIKEKIELQIRRLLKSGKLSRILNDASKNQAFRIPKAMLNANKNLLPCKNAMTIDLSGDDYIIKKSSSSDHFTKTINTVYDKNAKCPNWIKFLKSTHKDKEVIDLIQEICGSILTGNVDFQKIFFHYGSGGNGKSIFFSILKELFGEFATTADSSIVEVSNHRYMDSIARLDGARLVVAQETSYGKYLNESTVKDITGNDTVVGKYLYKNTFEFIPQFTLMIYGNYKPKLDGASDGIKRRMTIIPWKETFPEGSSDYISASELKESLRKEFPGILNWCLEGWKRLKSNKWIFSNPKIVQLETDSYISKYKSIQSFIDDCLEYIPYSSFVKLSKKLKRNTVTIYSKYVEYCKERDIEVKSKSDFKEEMLTRKIKHIDKEFPIEEYEEAKYTKGYKNIIVKSESSK